MQTRLFETAVEMFRRGWSPSEVAQELGIPHAEADAWNTAIEMFREGASHGDLINALRGLGLSQYDADEISLYAMAAVRRGQTLSGAASKASD